MPRAPRRALIWSPDHHRYEWYTHGLLERSFAPEDGALWLTGLAGAADFAFHGSAGRLNVYEEARPRGGRYWYAYHSTKRRTIKHYLGRTSSLTFARLEEAAHILNHEMSSVTVRPNPPGNAQDVDAHERALASSREGGRRLTLPMTKFARPILPQSLIVRERLLSRLDAAQSRRWTLLSASAGWGKTTLLSMWASRSSLPIAWLSLDELDNDPSRFWIAVIAALRHCNASLSAVGEDALAMLHSAQPPLLTTILATLLNELSVQAEPTVLALDDYHLIEEQAIHEAMLFALERVPERLHIVVASRIDPPLHISRWRASGQLLELREPELRFNEDEAACFLTKTMDLALEATAMGDLARRTEGWIVGLQLAALALRDREDPTRVVSEFTGGHRYVLDYVQEEVLPRLGPALQSFVLYSAVLERMSAPLCQAVTAESESQRLLETIERANLFLVPLDDERHWYRFHDLFREALLARLHATQPDVTHLLHHRAACWYEAHGEWREAISHALAADSVYAADLMERAASHLWLSNDARTMLAWLAALPDEVLYAHARLALNTALRVLESSHLSLRARYVRTRAQVEQVLARLETLLERRHKLIIEGDEQPLIEKAGEVALLWRRLRQLRTLIAAREFLTRGDSERLLQLSQQIEGVDDDEELRWKMLSLSLTIWHTETLQRDGAILIPRLMEVKRQALEAGDARDTLRVKHWLAFAYMRAGRWRLVEQECLEALALAERMGEQDTVTGYVYSLLASAYYAQNRLTETTECLQRLMRIGQTWQQADLLIAGNLTLTEVELARGELVAADRALQQAEALIQQEQLATQVFSVMAARVQYWLAAGDLDAARNWAEQVTFSVETWTPSHQGAFLTHIRVLLALRQYAQAVEALERFRAHLDRLGDVLHAMSFLSLYVVALRQAGMNVKAHNILARLLELTSAESVIRVYLDAGTPMREAIQSFLDELREEKYTASTVSRAYISTLLRAFDQEEERYKGRTLGPLLSSQGASSASTLTQDQLASFVTLRTSLTAQEQRVLELVATGLSNQEIAQTLVVSLNTVKTHLKHLYRKLNVRNRLQASTLAHDLFRHASRPIDLTPKYHSRG
jgi:LuxR family transcriptional regulator, maltose regulon positive regulatory protein